MPPYARYRIVYNRLKRLDKNGEGLIHLEVNYAGKRKYISSGIHIKPSQWDEKNRRIVKKNNASFLMDEIRKMIRRCEDFEAEKRYRDQHYTITELAAVARQETAEGDFIAFMEQEITRAPISYHSQLHQLTTLKALKEFGRIRSWSDLTWENIDAFNYYLTSKGLAVNTIANYHKHIKTYIRKGIMKDLFDAGRDPYIKYKVKRVKKGREALTEDEVRHIEALDISGMNNALEYTRDLFLFSCYTGLRYSDIMALRKENIIEDDDGMLIKIAPAKTSEMSGAEVTLPLAMLFAGRPQEIIRKYMGRDKIFPEISNQHLNRYLKALAIAAGINRNVTFHMARHTFGTFLANKTGDPFLIKSLMGHSKIETSMLYIHESRAGNEEKLKRISW